MGLSLLERRKEGRKGEGEEGRWEGGVQKGQTSGSRIGGDQREDKRPTPLSVPVVQQVFVLFHIPSIIYSINQSKEPLSKTFLVLSFGRLLPAVLWWPPPPLSLFSNPLRPDLGPDQGPDPLFYCSLSGLSRELSPLIPEPTEI